MFALNKMSNHYGIGSETEHISKGSNCGIVSSLPERLFHHEKVCSSGWHTLLCPHLKYGLVCSFQYVSCFNPADLLFVCLPVWNINILSFVAPPTETQAKPEEPSLSTTSVCLLQHISVSSLISICSNCFFSVRRRNCFPLL